MPEFSCRLPLPNQLPSMGVAAGDESSKPLHTARPETAVFPDRAERARAVGRQRGFGLRPRSS
jgi:hypothetical protein